MDVWRICRGPYSGLDAEGSRLYGGRWNSEGIPLIYTASSVSLASLEYLVHLDVGNAPADLVLLTMSIPGTIQALSVELSDLPTDWNQTSDHPSCVRTGDAWQQSASSLLLRVPSAVVTGESNYLINPQHPDMVQVISFTKPFTFDPRLLR